MPAGGKICQMQLTHFCDEETPITQKLLENFTLSLGINRLGVRFVTFLLAHYKVKKLHFFHNIQQKNV